MRCPKCSSENVQVHYETEKKGFSGGQGCCGWLIFGPIGVLCGLCGKDNVKSEEKYWVCNNCGARFSDYEAEEGERIFNRNNEIQNIFDSAESDLYATPHSQIFIQRKKIVIDKIKTHFSTDELKQFVFLNIGEQYNSILYFNIMKTYSENINLDLSKDCVYFIYRNGLHGYIFTNAGIYYDDKFFISSSNIKNTTISDEYLQINNDSSNIKLNFHHIAKNPDALIMLKHILDELYINNNGELIE